MSGRFVTLLVTAVAAALVLTACGKSLDSADLEQKLTDSLASTGTQYADAKVTCPDDIPAEKGKHVTCTVNTASFGSVKIDVVQLDDRGRFRYQAVPGTAVAPDQSAPPVATLPGVTPSAGGAGVGSSGGTQTPGAAGGTDPGSGVGAAVTPQEPVETTTISGG
jgi:hypothetical protein